MSQSPSSALPFWFPRDRLVTPRRDVVIPEGFEVETRSRVTDFGRRAEPGAPLALEGAGQSDPSKQFIVFQLNSRAEGPAILDCTEVEPAVVGSPDEPDVLVRLEMLAFHVGDAEPVEPDTRATMRINLGKDESSTDKKFDTVFWSIAAGLSLYDQAQRKPAESKRLRAAIGGAFGNRPIEIPGGLGRLTFEVVRHTEPPWWKRVFGFLQSGAADKLVSLLGFPAITLQAIDALDELLNRVADSQPKPLFKSLPMRLAFSRFARDQFTGGSARMRIGCLSQGACVLARASEYDRFAGANLGFDATIGRLVPMDAKPQDVRAGPDVLGDVTYAVFRVGMRGARLDPTFNFGA